MLFSKKNISLIAIILIVSACSSMTVSEESISNNTVKTVQVNTDSDTKKLTYENKAVFANATVYFDFDKSNLSIKSIQTLKSVVKALNSNSSMKITLSGHADERGTREYNLALGQRRAESVRDYLVLNGISKSRISVQSFGEEKPIAFGQNDISYAKNRRVEIN
tara:strand:- start:39 stop:530 length:492 start_codon:yes stop_codon:yes gene_type:complete